MHILATLQHSSIYTEWLHVHWLTYIYLLAKINFPIYLNFCENPLVYCHSKFVSTCIVTVPK
jgi:hypothetical protein